MKYGEIFKNDQKIAYKTIYNGFLNDKKSHVYLISGDKTSPLLETAIYIAKSFICKNDILCCEECNDCKRIDNNSYPDLKIINKDNKGIVKDDILSLQEDFSISPLEGNCKVYIINHIEDGGDNSMNKLLKFIEEPENNIYGIITTQNINKVLPTIISRCQVIKLVDIDKNQIEKELLENNINEDDAYLLSRFSYSINYALDLYNNSKYEKIKDLAFDFARLIIEKDNDIILFINTKVNSLIDKSNQNTNLKLFLELVNAILLSLAINDSKLNFRYDGYIDKEYIEKVISKIMLSINKLDYRLNYGFVLDKLGYEIVY